MRELEALEKIRETLQRVFNFPFNLTEEYKILKKAFTPPTEEEVCKVLSEYIKRPIEYYAPAKQFVIRCSNGYHEIARLHGTNEISFDTTYCLPPYHIGLLARFYKGLGE
jgi:hypothetical protein